MTRALFLLLALSAPLPAGGPLYVTIDGQTVGTLAQFEYRLAEGELHITTREGVYGCAQDRIFSDRFE